MAAITSTPWKMRGLSVGGGLLLAAAFPPWNIWPLASMALIPVFAAIWCLPPKLRGTRPDAEEAVPESGSDLKSRPGFWRGFRLGWLFGYTFFLATLWWVQYVSIPGMILLNAYLALFPAVFFGASAWLLPEISRRKKLSLRQGLGVVLVLSGAWSGLEWLRSVALSGFPWNSLAAPVFSSPTLRGLAAWTGVSGLSFLLVLVQGLVTVFVIGPGNSRASRIGALVVLAAAYYGLLDGRALLATRKIPSAPNPEFSALLIQPNVSMGDKMSPDSEVQNQRYRDLWQQTQDALTKAELESNQPDLVIWPESAIPGYFDDFLQSDSLAGLLKQGPFTLITGADHEDYEGIYNTVGAMRGTPENHELRAKVRLVPFGEFIPFRREFPPFEWMIGGLIPRDFTPGTSLEPMKVEGQAFSLIPLVCFEDTMAEHARQFIRPEPQVMINVTNDNWFAESPAPEIHFINARWRAVELHRTLVRSSNTGITGIVSPDGTIRKIPAFEKNTLSGKFSAGQGNITFFAAHGDLASKTAGGLALLAVVGIAIQRYRKRPGPGNG